MIARFWLMVTLAEKEKGEDVVDYLKKSSGEGHSTE